MNSIIPSVLISAPLFHPALYTPGFTLLSQRWGLHNSHLRSSIWIVAPVLDFALLTPPPPVPPFESSSTGRTLINSYQCYSAWIGTPLLNTTLLTPPPTRASSAFLDALLSTWAVCRIDLALFFRSLRFSNTFRALLVSTPHFPSSHSSCPCSWSLFPSEYIILSFKPQFWFAAS